jgi:MATE family multidrug resistance protein
MPLPHVRRTSVKSLIHLIDPPVCWRILRLAGPLILSMTGLLLMQLCDGLFLSWYSADAIAAIGPASMAALIFSSIVMGAAGYTSTLTAHYYGAEEHAKIGPAVWQGIYLALVSGCLGAALAPFGRALFDVVGHAPQVCAYEKTYFSIICYGMPISLVATALSGFFSGRGSNLTLMSIQVAGLLLNGVLAYALIWGHWGLPELGVAGAAWATVVAQAVISILLAVRFLRRASRRRYATWSGRAYHPEMMRRLLHFGLPGGLRFSIEIMAWTAFLFFVGRIGTTELAATSIAWRINGMAFFPIIGLSEAIRTLVGQALGKGNTDESVHVTLQGLLLAEVWMLFAAAVFVLMPRPLYALFQTAGDAGAADFAAVTDMGVVLLRFVAAYCVLDALNIVLTGMLQAAGDTRWTMWVSLLAHAVFLAALLPCDLAKLGLYAEWTVATAFVLAISLVWLWRFLAGEWRHIRVIETSESLTELN